MSVDAVRVVNVQYSGEGLDANNSFAAATNASSPAEQTYTNLSSGANTITVPTGATACTIIPPAGNTTSITFKGVTGDTGVRLHNTDPSSIAIHSTVTTFCLTAGGAITGVRLVWS